MEVMRYAKLYIKYTVDGVTYNASPDLITNTSEFEQTAIVKYNPSNPSEYVMDAKWNTMLISGIIIMLICIFFIIYIKKKYDKLSNVKNDNQINNI